MCFRTSRFRTIRFRISRFRIIHFEAMHFRHIFSLSLFLTAMMLGACSSPSIKRDTSPSANQKLYTPSVKQTKSQKKLARHYRHWQNTPYKLGGLSENGIDCSGFVYITYRDVFGTRIPRSTKLLAKTGKNVAQNKLKFGDLIFFKTGISQRHVGIYIGDRKFIHASTSRGVMRSSIDSPYWNNSYWKAKRILN